MNKYTFPSSCREKHLTKLAVFGFSVLDKKWTELDSNQHRTHAMRLLDGLEVTAREKRLKVARAILYVAQGMLQCWQKNWSCSEVPVNFSVLNLY